MTTSDNTPRAAVELSDFWEIIRALAADVPSDELDLFFECRKQELDEIQMRIERDREALMPPEPMRDKPGKPKLAIVPKDGEEAKP